MTIYTNSLSGPAFPSSRPCPSSKEFARFNIKSLRELRDHHNGCVIDAALQRADIGTVNAGLVSQCLLRKTPCVSRLPQIASEDLSYIHAREANPLSCISPRSMLDNRTVTRASSFLFFAIDQGPVSFAEQRSPD